MKIQSVVSERKEAEEPALFKVNFQVVVVQIAALLKSKFPCGYLFFWATASSKFWEPKQQDLPIKNQQSI